MTTTEKREIQYKLRIYVSSFSSQNKAVKSLSNVSEATVIAMLSQDEFGWVKISDSMWRNVSAQVGGVVDFSKLVETKNFHIITSYLDVAKEKGASFSLVGAAGWGKSYTARWYAAVNRRNNVYYIECAEYMGKKTFLQYLLMQMGENYFGLAEAELMETIIREIRKQGQPLIILDEVDKLKDVVLKFFITLYNKLNRSCGFVWLSTDAIKKRITSGINKNAIGYQEIFSRIGSSFINLAEPSRDEVAEICTTNNISDPEHIAIICNEVHEVKGDLRRVDRNILKDDIKKQRKRKKTGEYA